MYLLEPISKKRIWGTGRLHEYGGDSKIDQIGSIYTMAGNKDFSCRILNNEKKLNLYDVVQEDPKKFGVEQGENFPIIVSLTGAEKDLSIQVHPTDEYAQSHEGVDVGKSESWFFIDPPENGWIYAGSKLTNKEEIKEHMLSGEFENVVDTIEVKKGDLVYIPSGTLHALTKGSLVYEIQQSTDITYRFYDYDRLGNDGQKRELHLEKALDTLVLEQKTVQTDFLDDVTYDQKAYSIKKKTLSGSYTNTEKVAQVVTNLSGTTTVNGEEWIKGFSLIVLPEETIQIDGALTCVVATPHRYWRGS